MRLNLPGNDGCLGGGMIENNFLVFHSGAAILHHCLGLEVIICGDM